MIRAELLKLRLQRTPQVLLGLAFAALLITIGVTVGKDLKAVDYVSRANEGTFILLPILAGILGGFVMGAEYRQDTLKRLAAVGPRRGRILATKVGVLLGAIVGASLAVYGLAVGAMAVLASASGVSFPWGDAWPSLVEGLVFATSLGLLSFALSLITRTDLFAMIGAIAIPLVFDTLVGSLVSGAARFTLSGAVSGTLANLPQLPGAEGSSDPLLAPVAAGLVLLAWIVVPLGLGARRFATTDI